MEIAASSPYFLPSSHFLNHQKSKKVNIFGASGYWPEGKWLECVFRRWSALIWQMLILQFKDKRKKG